MKFLGYQRPDGSAGIRNYVLIIPGGFIASKICDFVIGTRTIHTADHGSGRTRADREAIARVLVGLGKNPNVGAVIVHTASPGAGYPELAPERLAEEIAVSGKPVELINPAKDGGTFGAIEKGVKIARRLVYEISKQRREPCDFGQLAIGVKCGYSDPTSGIAGNPAVGYLYDRLVEAGGVAMFGETTEIIGAEQALAKRAVNEEVAREILRTSEVIESLAKASGQDIRSVNPVPSNIAAGITTLEEKSLGAVYKAGTAPIKGVLKYAERPSGRGLYFVDNWMGHLSIFLGYAAAGAQLVIFQLGGGGTPGRTILESAPSVVAPLLWATANPVTYGRSEDSVDYFSGTVIDGSETPEEAGERLVQTVLGIASGTCTRSETLNYCDPAQVYTREPVF
ncbi:MAG: UxaA family hydrolase [Syntrophomonadaceae bacterium]|nr:UxaA family hydrolase [Syntrophomonadaceae bacterium]